MKNMRYIHLLLVSVVQSGLLLGMSSEIASFIAGKNTQDSVMISRKLELGYSLPHEDYINYVAISRNGQKIASVSPLSNQIRIWEPETDKSRLFQSNGGYILGVTWSSDANKVIIATADGAIEVLDSVTGKKSCAKFKNAKGFPGLSAGIASSPNGKQIAVSSSSNKILLIKAAELRVDHELEGSVSASALAGWSPDGRRFAAAYQDGTVKLWDTQNWELLQEKKIHEKGVTSLVWSPDGTCLASASQDNTVARWNGRGELQRMNIDPQVLFPMVAWLSEQDLVLNSPYLCITTLNFHKKNIQVLEGTAPIASAPDKRTFVYSPAHESESESIKQYIRVAKLAL